MRGRVSIFFGKQVLVKLPVIHTEAYTAVFLLNQYDMRGLLAAARFDDPMSLHVV